MSKFIVKKGMFCATYTKFKLVDDGCFLQEIQVDENTIIVVGFETLLEPVRIHIMVSVYEGKEIILTLSKIFNYKKGTRTNLIPSMCKLLDQRYDKETDIILNTYKDGTSIESQGDTIDAYKFEIVL